MFCCIHLLVTVTCFFVFLLFYRKARQLDAELHHVTGSLKSLEISETSVGADVDVFTVS